MCLVGVVFAFRIAAGPHCAASSAALPVSPVLGMSPVRPLASVPLTSGTGVQRLSRGSGLVNGTKSSGPTLRGTPVGISEDAKALFA